MLDEHDQELLPRCWTRQQVLEMHIDLAARYNQLILVHTPHLEDKYKGARDPDIMFML